MKSNQVVNLFKYIKRDFINTKILSNLEKVHFSGKMFLGLPGIYCSSVKMFLGIQLNCSWCSLKMFLGLQRKCSWVIQAYIAVNKRLQNRNTFITQLNSNQYYFVDNMSFNFFVVLYKEFYIVV